MYFFSKERYILVLLKYLKSYWIRYAEFLSIFLNNIQIFALISLWFVVITNISSGLSINMLHLCKYPFPPNLKAFNLSGISLSPQKLTLGKSQKDCYII